MMMFLKLFVHLTFLFCSGVYKLNAADLQSTLCDIFFLNDQTRCMIKYGKLPEADTKTFFNTLLNR